MRLKTAHVTFWSHTVFFLERRDKMAWGAVSNFEAHLSNIVFFGGEQSSGEFHFVIQQLSVNGFAIDVLEAFFEVSK